MGNTNEKSENSIMGNGAENGLPNDGTGKSHCLFAMADS
jgi:hypothetical protein